MIINFPTGFYETVVATPPEVPNSITYKVSNESPPRTQLLFVKTPVGLSHKKRSPRVYTDEQRRAAVSKLAFSVAVSRGAEITTGMKQFEVGQTLEFESGTVPTKVDPMLVPQTTEIRHDTNLLDYDALGLAATTQATMNTESAAAYQTLLTQLNTAVKSRADYETRLQTTQKMLNEVKKTIDGLTAVLEIGSTNPALVRAKDELTVKKAELEQEQRSLTMAANQAAADASAIQAKVSKVAQLVR